MTCRTHWAIVLAAGQGTRLSTLTTDDGGMPVPKQFCSLRGGASLLEAALARAERVVPRERVLVVVAAEHEPFWRGPLAHLPRENIVVQPRNRGTAAGCLLPLLMLLAREPDPAVVVLPSDHYVGNEEEFARALLRAFASVDNDAAGVVLLGIPPDAATADYGWIVPGESAAPVKPVQTFVEKPDQATAQRLMRAGGVWNSFVFVAKARALVAGIGRCLPGLAKEMRDAALLGGDAIARAYETMASADLSRQVFEQMPEELRVLQAAPCGWTDLGTPQRLGACLAALVRADLTGIAVAKRTARVDLERQLRRTALFATA